MELLLPNTIPLFVWDLYMAMPYYLTLFLWFPIWILGPLLMSSLACMSGGSLWGSLVNWLVLWAQMVMYFHVVVLLGYMGSMYKCPYVSSVGCIGLFVLVVK